METRGIFDYCDRTHHCLRFLGTLSVRFRYIALRFWVRENRRKKESFRREQHIGLNQDSKRTPQVKIVKSSTNFISSLFFLSKQSLRNLLQFILACYKCREKQRFFRYDNLSSTKEFNKKTKIVRFIKMDEIVRWMNYLLSFK